MTFIKNPVQIVEIQQPLCNRTFGTSPCLATGDRCYNTDFTCKFRSALDLSESLSLYFVMDMAYEWYQDNNELLTEASEVITTESGDPLIADEPAPFQASVAIPSLVSVRTAPTVLNVASGSRNRSPLGNRAVCNVRIKDHPWNDIDVDPYLSTRTFDPTTQGTFWGKWLARNPFHEGYTLNVYEGELGQTLPEMSKRQYIIDKIDFGRDGVSITAKDILSEITGQRRLAPSLSTGVLTADINNSVTTITAAGAVLDDYPATGWVRIGNEVLAYTSRALVGSDVQFTGITRGALDTTADSHRQNERVQRVLAYEDEQFQDIIFDLLTVWGGIPSGFIDKSEWDQERADWRGIFNFTAYITQPTPVEDLVSEVCLQAISNIWWDERQQEIILRALRPTTVDNRLDQDANIKAGSFAIKELPEERVSQVFVYYNLRNPTLSITDPANYENAEVRIDVGKQIQYGGEPVVRELFCRFIPTQIIAGNLATTYLNRFKDVRREVTFSLANDEQLWTGDNVSISHFLDQNEFGLPRRQNWLIIEAAVDSVGSTYRFVAEDNNSAGIPWVWQGEDVPIDWDDATPEERVELPFWLNDDGTDPGGNQRLERWL
jgi:hypothetical protein